MHSKKIKRYKFWFLIAVIGILVGAIGWFFAKPEPTLSEQRTDQAQNITFDWPSQGRTSIGTLDGGLMAVHGDTKPYPTASVAKVITALVALDKYPISVDQPERTITISRDDVARWEQTVADGGSNVEVAAGDVWTEYEMIEGMLMASGNNLADSLAVWAFGSLPEYQKAANAWLAKNGLDKTHVGSDASGLDPTTVSSVDDLFKLGTFAMKNSIVKEIVRKNATTLPGVGEINNTNELLGIDRMVGIKTGFTDKAGACLLFAEEIPGPDGQTITIIGASMGQKDPDGKYDSIIKLIDSVANSVADPRYRTN